MACTSAVGSVGGGLGMGAPPSHKNPNMHSRLSTIAIPAYTLRFTQMPSKPTPPKPADHTFESALERLEGIVEEMEGDRLPLELLLERYSEGTGLLKVCQEKLDAAEKKIEIITRSAS